MLLLLFLSCFSDHPEHSQKKASVEEFNEISLLFRRMHVLNSIPLSWTNSLSTGSLAWPSRDISRDSSYLIYGNLTTKIRPLNWSVSSNGIMQKVFDVGCDYADRLSFLCLGHRERQKRNKSSKKECLPVNGGASEAHPLQLDVEEKPEEEYPSVVLALARTFKLSLLAGGLFKLIFDVIQFGFPQLLKMLIGFVERGNEPTWYGVSIATGMLVLSSVQTLVGFCGDGLWRQWQCLTGCLDTSTILPPDVPRWHERSLCFNGGCLQKSELDVGHIQ